MFRDALQRRPARGRRRRALPRASSPGVTDPEQKRKIIGREFIEVFEEEATKIGERATFLAQGTLYPDVIESVSFKGPSARRSRAHHNVGGLPERMKLKLVEPLRELFKDEVRELGARARAAAPHALAPAVPGPGPRGALPRRGDARARCDVLRDADAIVDEEIRAAGLYESIWQSFGVLLPVRSGRRDGRRAHVRGDARGPRGALARRHDRRLGAAAVRAARARSRSRIINEVRGINRVVYDITSKPPGTIEWE